MLCIEIELCLHIILSNPIHNVTFILVVSSTSLIDCMCHCNLEIFVIMCELLYPKVFESDNFIVEYYLYLCCGVCIQVSKDSCLQLATVHPTMERYANIISMEQVRFGSTSHTIMQVAGRMNRSQLDCGQRWW